METRWRLCRMVVLITGVLAAAFALSACGGGSSSSSSTAETTEAAEATEAADTTAASGGESEAGGGSSAQVESILEAAVAPAKWEGPTEKAPAASGKHIDVILTLAAAEGEQLLQQGAETATKALGWKTTYIDGKGTPQGYEAAINQAITEGVDGVIFGAITPSLVPNGLKALKAAGIPLVIQSNVEEPKEELWLGNVGYNPEKEAEYLAAFMAKEANGEAKIALFEDKEFGIVAERAKFFKPKLEELCPTCEIINETEMQVTELETKLTPKTSGVLQANPEINYIYSPYDAAVPAIDRGDQAGGPARKTSRSSPMAASSRAPNTCARRKSRTATSATPPSGRRGRPTTSSTGPSTDSRSRRTPGTPTRSSC